MTEAEWLASNDPAAMLEALQLGYDLATGEGPRWRYSDRDLAFPGALAGARTHP